MGVDSIHPSIHLVLGIPTAVSSVHVRDSSPFPLHTKYINDKQTVKDGVKLDAKKMKDAIERVQVLEAYLDEARDA